MVAQASIQAPAQRQTRTLRGQWRLALIGTIFLLWVLFYPAGLLLRAIMGGVLVLAVAAGIYYAIGALQQPLTGALYPAQATGWKRRTLVGGVLALLVLVGTLALLSAVYGGGPLTDKWGVFLIQGGDPLQIGWTLAAWALAGAVLGLVQWGGPWRGAAWAWAGMSAAGWAAAALLNWGLFRHLVVGYDQIGLSGLFGLVKSAGNMMLVAAVIALIAGLAFWHRWAAVAASALVALGAFVLLFGAPKAPFTPRTMQPLEVLSGPSVPGYPVNQQIGFSADGAFLAALQTTDTPSLPRRIVLWSTRDWQRVGTLTSLGDSVRISVPPGVEAVARPAAAWNGLTMQRTSDGMPLTSVFFSADPGQPPAGYRAWTDQEEVNWLGFQRVLKVQRPNGQIIVMDPSLQWTNATLFYRFSPDGWLVAASDEHSESLWIWRLP